MEIDSIGRGSSNCDGVLPVYCELVKLFVLFQSSCSLSGPIVRIRRLDDSVLFVFLSVLRASVVMNVEELHH